MKKILIVEDIELNIDLLVQLLEEDYALEVARDGEEAVRMAMIQQPDLILMDISLPKMDGYEATKIIHCQLPELPIIGLSAHAMQSDLDRALSSGFISYLTKPLDEMKLISDIEAWIGK